MFQIVKPEYRFLVSIKVTWCDGRLGLSSETPPGQSHYLQEPYRVLL